MKMACCWVYVCVTSTIASINIPDGLEIYWSHWKILKSDSQTIPDSKVHGVNIGPIWGRQDPSETHVGPVNFGIWGMRCYAIADYVFRYDGLVHVSRIPACEFTQIVLSVTTYLEDS